MKMHDGSADVVIVGGGPAGMQVALVLSRAGRNVVVFDDPDPPRNAASHGVHNVLGLDGLLPDEVRSLAWKQIDVYGAARETKERVLSIKQNSDKNFVVTGSDGTTLEALHLVVAVGYHDVYPEVPGFLDCWAGSVIQCPFCDGYENRDRVWGVVVDSEASLAGSVKMARNWTKRIKAIANDFDDDLPEEIESAGLSVRVYKGPIERIYHEQGKVTGITLPGDENVEVETLWWKPAKRPSPLIGRLVEEFGLELDESGYVVADENQQTSVERMWAVGDVQGSAGALNAAASGAKAAQSIVRDWYG